MPRDQLVRRARFARPPLVERFGLDERCDDEREDDRDDDRELPALPEPVLRFADELRFGALFEREPLDRALLEREPLPGQPFSISS